MKLQLCAAAALCILSGGKVPWDAKRVIHSNVGLSYDPDIFLTNSRNAGGNRKFVCPCLEEFPQKKFVIKFPINSFEELLLRRELPTLHLRRKKSNVLFFCWVVYLMHIQWEWTRWKNVGKGEKFVGIVYGY